MLNIFKVQREALVWIWGYEHTCFADGQRQKVTKRHRGHLKQRFYALDSSRVVFALAQSKAYFQWNCRYCAVGEGEWRKQGI